MQDSAARYRHYFRRDDLRGLVWRSSVSEVAVRLGVFDVALAKPCSRAKIAMPGQVLARGGLLSRLRGEAPPGLPEWLRIGGTKPAMASRAPDNKVVRQTLKNKNLRVGRAIGGADLAIAAVPDVSGSAP